MKLDRIKVIAEMARQMISVGELSNRSGLSKATITNVRSGKSCSELSGKLIAQALGVEITEIVEMEG